MNSKGYQIESWDGYARSHVSVLTSQQWLLFNEVVKHLNGSVVDCGCGTARLAPLLADNPDVVSYLGIDMSPDMVRVARWVTHSLKKRDFEIWHGRIEEAVGEFSSAVSVHSYYSWPEPRRVLAAIYRLLMEEGRFVLATPNLRLDMPKLLKEAKKELLGHPDFDDFCEMNLLFASHPEARFVTIDTLIDEVRSVGFRILECHQHHYLSGVNLLIMEK